MITNAMIGYEYRSMINPVSGTTVSSGGGGGGGGINITLAELQSLYIIHDLYTTNLANKTYEQIPTNLTQYLQLRSAANDARIKYGSNPALAVLFQITVDALTGAINAYGLNNLICSLWTKRFDFSSRRFCVVIRVNVVRKTFLFSRA